MDHLSAAGSSATRNLTTTEPSESLNRRKTVDFRFQRPYATSGSFFFNKPMRAMDSRRDFTSKKVFSGYFSELGEKANSALLTERMRNCLPRSELPSPASARLRVGALDAARPGRRAVAVSVGRKTGCGEETTISPGSLAHEANGSTHNKRQYQPLGSNRQYTCKISSGSMVPCCEFKLSTHHQFYRSASLQTPAIVANERSSASIAPSSSISAL